MSDFIFSSGAAFFSMLNFAYIWLLGVHLGSHRGSLRSRTPPNIIFEMSFYSLMTSARKRNGSKKSQSLGSEIMCHSKLVVNRNIYPCADVIKISKNIPNSGDPCRSPNVPQKAKNMQISTWQKQFNRAESEIWHDRSSIFDGIFRFWAFGLAKIARKAIFIILPLAKPIASFFRCIAKNGNRWRW